MILFCVDFQKLNNKTLKDAYSLPKIEEILHLLAGPKYLMKLNIRSGYWQIEIHEDEKSKTAFYIGALRFNEFGKKFAFRIMS